jgi:hypothetical protein
LLHQSWRYFPHRFAIKATTAVVSAPCALEHCIKIDSSDDYVHPPPNHHSQYRDYISTAVSQPIQHFTENLTPRRAESFLITSKFSGKHSSKVLTIRVYIPITSDDFNVLNQYKGEIKLFATSSTPIFVKPHGNLR